MGAIQFQILIMMQIKLAQKKQVVIPLKHLELILTWTKNCALADMTVRAAGNNNDPPAIVAPTGLEFQITDTKLYIPVVTLSK